VSTNPISIAVPGGDRGPLVLDMATSVISAGGLAQARMAGQPIAPGLAIDEHGVPTTDPNAAKLPLPLGGPKGSGLSLMIECLTSLVVSNGILAEALSGSADGRRHKQNGLVLALDVARFSDPVLFRAEVDRLVAAVKALPRAPGVAEILVPGERGERTFERRSREGIPIPAVTRTELSRVAGRLGVSMV
jgi:ureidoglycolate dehydrogenase (NAD+)